MDNPLTLLDEARAAGVDVSVKDGQLRVRGPRAADTLARRLLDHRAELVSLLGRGEPRAARTPIAAADAPAITAGLAGGPVSVVGEHTVGGIRRILYTPTAERPAAPAQPCYACGGRRFWRGTSVRWICAVCHPPAVPRVAREWRNA